VNGPSLSGALCTFLRVLGSTISGPHSAVLVGGDSPMVGERRDDVEAYGAPGIVFRPRPPSTPTGESNELAAEALSLRTPDGLQPIAWRDLRWNRRFPAPKPGTVALVGYGGGFLSFDDAAGGASSKATLYVPYGRSDVDGTATKAMTIAIDPEQESMMLVHGDGYAIVMDKDNGVTLRGDDSTWLRVGKGVVEIVAAKQNLRGNVALGSNTAAAVPLLPGPSSQPTPSVFFSPT